MKADQITAMTTRPRRIVTGLLLLLLSASCSAPAQKADVEKATQGIVTRGDLEVVDCLLPGQVRQIGNTPYVTARRPVRTTTGDCRIRGGEYVAYDRADLKSALRVWMAAAESGDADAQTNVGEIYERGLGDQPNYEAAAIWYQKAADQGYARAQFNLGTLYEQGRGVEQDTLKAMNLYRQAWGVSTDNLLYESGVRKEEENQRKELQATIDEKSKQLDLLQKQLAGLETKLRKQAASTARPAAGDDGAAEIATLRTLVAQLQRDRDGSQARLNRLPAVTREPGDAPAAGVPLDQSVPARALAGMDMGRYFALVIGNQDYQQLDPLQTPLADARAVAKVLKEKYGFNVKVLNDANDVAMLGALNDLYNVLKPNDNLLIYYAGHGRKETAGDRLTGYWLPVNSEKPPRNTFWIQNEQITFHLGRMLAKRILVIADSCYAGLLSDDPSMRFLGSPGQVSLDYVKVKMQRRSRLLISSGGDSPVLDQGGQGDSVFAEAFLQVLDSNNSVLSAPGLYAKLQEKVSAAAAKSGFSEKPEYKALKSAGHEVGDFFFVPVTAK